MLLSPATTVLEFIGYLSLKATSLRNADEWGRVVGVWQLVDEAAR